MADITNQSLNEIIENVKRKKISSTEITKAYIKNWKTSWSREWRDLSKTS